MSQTKLLPNEGREHPHHSSMRVEYRALFVLALLLGAGLTFGLMFGLRPVDQSARIATLEATTTHLNAELMSVMMNALTFSTRYVQNGTCKLGFPLDQGPVPVSVAEFSDYVEVEYSLKEIILTQASVPLSVLVFGPTSRPITFPGYTPAPSVPREANLNVYLGLCDPPIVILDAVAQNYDVLSYSYVTASKIVLEPNCVAMSLSEQDSSHCHPEVAIDPFYPSSYSPNAVNLYPINTYGPGQAMMQFIWGHWDYTSLATVYDFVGTNVSFSAPIEFLLPNV